MHIVLFVIAFQKDYPLHFFNSYSNFSSFPYHITTLYHKIVIKGGQFILRTDSPLLLSCDFINLEGESVTPKEHWVPFFAGNVAVFNKLSL